MIVYSSTKSGFAMDVMTNQIEKTILSSFVREMGHSTGQAEVASWRNSMLYMNNVVSDPAIPDDAGIAIEYKIPQTSKRIDFILTGMNEENRKTAILVELKQWGEAEITELDGVVKTFVGGNKREVNHPSYQVWSYATLLEDYNGNVQSQDISLVPCAYLHNYEPDNVITNDFYKEYTDKAPVFLKPDALKLQAFLKKYVKYGDKGDVLYAIENGKIRPSKALADNLASMLQGNREFILIDDQKLVYETALKLAKESNDTNESTHDLTVGVSSCCSPLASPPIGGTTSSTRSRDVVLRWNNKNVLIVEGGPGTGKSVIAINLLTKLTKQGNVTQYVTKNSAPREVYQVKLTGKFTKTRIANLFSASGSFYNIEPNTFDSLIVDEAHRLNAKSGLFSHLGENQIKELINASKFCIFFIDEDQRVTLKDIGKKSEIINWANKLGAKVHNMELASQFRCNGSDGYLAWLDNILQIKQTANEALEDINFDFQVMDNPSLVHQKIIQKNTLNNKSRIVAGYCWKWISKNNPNLKDIVIGDYAATWNLDSHGQAWIVHPESVKEIGCIHTCQGLELDYVGVIIGPDMIVRDGKVITDATKRASTDQSLKGLKAKMQENPEEAKLIADMVIKNTYRTLMTRGMKGCYIYSTDPETQKYFQDCLSINKQKNVSYSNIPDGVSLTTDIKEI